MLHVQIDRTEWDELLKRIGSVELSQTSICATAKALGWIFGVLIASMIGVGLLIFTLFSTDRRDFLAAQNADRAFMMNVSEKLSLTQQTLSTFVTAGPRFTPEMNAKTDEVLAFQLKEWVRNNYPSVETKNTLSDHEKRIQAIEKKP